MKVSNILAGGVAALALAGGAQAATLTGLVNSDNPFSAYISSSDSTLGTLIGSGANWRTSDPISATLSSGVYYLHIVADNWTSDSDHTVIPGNADAGNPDAILGQFSLTGAKFSNGSTTLLTDTADWRATGQVAAGSTWSAPSGAPVGLGLNGVGPWGGVGDVSSNAQWIWSQTDPSGEAFFSTTIAAVPEPATWAMMLVGLGGLGVALRSRRKPAVAAA